MRFNLQPVVYGPRFSSFVISAGFAIALLLTAGCREKNTPSASDATPSATPPASLAEAEPASAAPDIAADYIETGDLDAIKKRGCLRFLILRQDEIHLPREGDPPNREVDLAIGFCNSIGVRPAAVSVTKVADLAPALLAGKGDLIASYLTPSDALKKMMAFSAPFQTYRELILGRAGAPALKKAADLKGRALAVQQDSAQWATGQALERRYPDIRLQVLSSALSPDAILDKLAAGRLDLVLTDSISAGILRQYRTDFKTILDLGTERSLVWGARPGNKHLLDALNGYIQKAPPAARNAAVYREDWPGIRKRKILRLITVNTAATYFLWKGDLAGFEYEMAKRFAEQNGLRLEVIVAPDYDALIPLLLSGRGDFIGAFLTITGERRALGVDFSAPYHYATEMIVARSTECRLKTLQDLVGREVMAPSSSYPWAQLGVLQSQGIAVKRRAAPAGSQPDDFLEWVAAGQIDLTVVDHHVLNMASGWLDDIRGVLALGEAQPEGWVVRARDRQLLNAINAFWKKEYKGTFYNIAYNRYFKNPEKIRQLAREHVKLYPDGAVSPYDDLVRRFAGLYNYDWRLIVAQMYQESRFDPKVVSPMGARGLMQVLPRTGHELGFRNLTEPPNGIHAGVKYMDTIDDRLPEDLDETNRMYFALASYNAGPGHVQDARILARRIGRNPNIWFGNVEEAMRLLSKPEYARRAKCGYIRGQEPVNYVRQIVTRYRVYLDLIAQQKAGHPNPALKH